MKKILVIAALTLGFAAAAVAQPKAIGIRGTYTGAEISYQHYLDANFVEADLGLHGKAFSLVGTYNWNLLEFGPGINLYAGPGAGAVLGSGIISLGVVGQVGIEYTFDFPLQLSLDIRPNVFNLAMVKGAGSYFSGPSGFWPFLGIRYAF